MKAALAGASRRLSWKPSTSSTSSTNTPSASGNAIAGNSLASSSSSNNVDSKGLKTSASTESNTEEEDDEKEDDENQAIDADLEAAAAAISIDDSSIASKGLIGDDLNKLLNSKILKIDENASVLIEYDGEMRGKWLDTVVAKATEEYRLSQGKTLPPVIPRFINCEKGDVTKGTNRWKNTLQWRVDNGVNYLLRVPHRDFDVIKKYYPHYFHFKDLQGRPVYWELVGKIDMTSLKKSGATLQTLLVHYMTVNEYLWEYICPSEDGRSLTIIDLKGTTIKQLTGDVLSFIRLTNSFIGQHYPEKAGNIILLNVPLVFNSAWKIIKGFIDPTTAKKIIFAKKSEVTKILQKYIPIENIPVEYGGKCTVPFGESPEEQGFQKLMKELNTRQM